MIVVRELEPRDCQAIYQIYMPFITDTAVTFETADPGLAEFSGRLLSIAGNYPFLVAESGGEIAGYAYASQHRSRPAYRWCTESSVYIHPSYTGKGLGHLLYSQLLEKLKKQDYRIVYGLITVPNEASIALHKKCGFKELAIHRNTGYKAGRWHDVLWMEKVLNEFSDNPPEPGRMS